MRWMTLAHLHLDRVASAWLISRFVDPEAQVEFLAWDADRPDDESITLFGMPGIELSSPDERGTCFSKILRAHDIEDPALWMLEGIVAAGVAHAHGNEPPAQTSQDVADLGAAFDLLGIGFGILADDADHLAKASPMYDAAYCLCRMRTLPADVQEQIPRLPGDRAVFVRNAMDMA
jgi:hypothetical protein